MCNELVTTLLQAVILVYFGARLQLIENDSPAARTVCLARTVLKCR